MIAIIIILVIIPTLFISVGAVISAPTYRGQKSDHFDGKKFFTPHGEKPQGLKEVIRWMMNRKKSKWNEEKKPSYGPRPLTFEKDNIRITYVNHSTFLIQVDGVNILTDPIWSQRASPFTWSGPKRVKFPGIRFEDLPRIHVVLISHNHYDHLDLQTMRMVFGGHHPKIYTPLGVNLFLDQEKISGAVALDWWETNQFNDSIKVEAVPAQHFSGRGFTDRNATLWCGYVLHTSKGAIYFCGDTGYNEVTFKEIGEKSGPMKVSLIPIGAYEPHWFMAPVHTSPDEAVIIHQDVRSQKSIGMHFGTFPLADESEGDAERDLKTALSRYNVNESDFITIKEGEPYVIE